MKVRYKTTDVNGLDVTIMREVPYIETTEHKMCDDSTKYLISILIGQNFYMMFKTADEEAVKAATQNIRFDFDCTVDGIEFVGDSGQADLLFNLALEFPAVAVSILEHIDEYEIPAEVFEKVLDSAVTMYSDKVEALIHDQKEHELTQEMLDVLMKYAVTNF